ncbi:alpha/beta hydrolase fold domain-containing protein [Lactobacillus sp. 3B(2020)]|uniref:alpha/beta hydrolase fold domain-containing protein n=1 Tax=Lactobacillus sp. 3B(2020) TaxID=2695882 RepID=UPI0015DE9F32|nr:alpha/beta hydrolase [Lactobacillus sp. 3B(2020)]QLL70686.1 alpha/beta hydrolase fold domain-containing protein [Lactobacillus sp. 3B(2020)]
MKKTYQFDQQTLRAMAKNLKNSVIELTQCGDHLSRQATMVGLGLQLSGLKRQLADPQKREALLQAASKTKLMVPQNITLVSEVQERNFSGRQGVVLNPQANPRTVVLALYGGALVLPPSKEHWQFYDRLAQGSGAEIIIPDYPHLPTGTVDQAVAYLQQVYESMYNQTPASEITVLGDSAGGGLATALVEGLTKQGLPVPGHLVLLSPWLDFSLQNPALKSYNQADLVLDRAGLQIFGKQFVGDLHTNDYRANPLKGPVKGLRDVHLFVGTKELMCLDTIEFANRLAQAKVSANLVIGRGLYHAYPLYSTPEGKAALEEITKVVKGACK